MGLPLLLLAAGTAMQVVGQWQANDAQAAAERKNAEFYRFQADYAKMSGEREGAIFQRETTKKLGAQQASVATSGLGGTSALAALAEAGANAYEEFQAIKLKSHLEQRTALERAGQAQSTAELISSPQYQTTQALGTILGGAARYSAATK